MMSPIGIKPILIYSIVGSISYLLDEYNIFLYATSFLQYMFYMWKYYERSTEYYEEFKRDAHIFKVVAQCQVFYLFYISTKDDWMNNPDWICVAFILGGYFISINSFFVLGDNGTYYAIELGLMKPDFKFTWPYGKFGFVPGVWHPMYMGQVYALLGMYKMASFRTAYPYLVPLHVLYYAVCIAQEVYDIHKGSWITKPKTK